MPQWLELSPLCSPVGQAWPQLTTISCSVFLPQHTAHQCVASQQEPKSNNYEQSLLCRWLLYLLLNTRREKKKKYCCMCLPQFFIALTSKPDSRKWNIHYLLSKCLRTLCDCAEFVRIDFATALTHGYCLCIILKFLEVWLIQGMFTMGFG